MQSKFNKKDVMTILAQNDLTLLSEFINVNSPLTIECNKGHIIESKSYLDWQLINMNCPTCQKGRRRYKENEVDEYLFNIGYKRLSTYQNTRNKLKVQCPEGHVYQTTFSHLVHMGRRCPVCAGNKKIDDQYVRQILIKHNMLPTFDHYKNAHQYLSYRCQNHSFEVQYTKYIYLQNGSFPKCKYCKKEKNRIIKSKKEIKEGVENMKHELALPKQKCIEVELLQPICDKNEVSIDLILRFYNISRLAVSEKTKLERIEQAIQSNIEAELMNEGEVS